MTGCYGVDQHSLVGLDLSMTTRSETNQVQMFKCVRTDTYLIILFLEYRYQSYVL